MAYVSEPTRLPTLLIVEDEFLIAHDLKRILIKAGYQVVGIAGSVDEAQHIIRDQRPDIVLLDIFLKGHKTGIDLAHWLNDQSIPFVFLSANLTDHLLEAAKKTQPFGFLTKPFREKDVLTALEIARYRHAHSEEAKLRQQQTIQIAVNNAIVTIQDREQLCLAIADQINRLVPFSFLNLRIGLPDEVSFYWLMLEKTASNTFTRVNLAALLQEDSTELLEKLDREAPDQLGELRGIFTGEAFDQLCASYITARSCRDHFGVRSLALFPIQLNRNSLTTIILSSTEPDGFTTKDYQAVDLIIPQIALALDNLLAYEELAARQQIKAIELAIVNAFRNGIDIGAILAQVAQSINELLPADLVGIYQLGRQTTSVNLDSTVQKVNGVFMPTDDHLIIPFPATTNTVDQRDARSWLIKPALNVGVQFTDTLPDHTLYPKTLGLQSSLNVPIFIKDQLIASLVLASKAAFAFTYKDLRIMQDISVQMGLALENLLAFERIKVLSEQLEQEKTYLTEEIKTRYNFEEIIGVGPAMQAVFTSIGQVAPTDATVLIMGETGTGKELVARAVHNLSTRKARTIVKINCAALPAQLIESELFGHERGSFTGATEKRIGKFELANGGTLFLDEIGELPLELQAKLLRAIQEKEIERIGGKGTIRIDTRIIAATNRNLQQEVAQGRFRSDLYYRLNVFPIVIPPLRERPDDIRPLAMHFLRRISKKLGKSLSSIANDSLAQLLSYSWPGNIRELEHVLERAAILSSTSTLYLAEPLRSTPLTVLPINTNPSTDVQPIDETMRTAIMAALAKSGYRIRGIGGAAELLNLKPTTLEARMKKLHISSSPKSD
ncbi:MULTISPECIES: sigma 54-interacting transcriptional regulator [unclassified Spirosoma]|uniref:sigma 54-interacting transcriptional regulator n=1 Tax=unclassified Spirosoma TaxID=2621999 RepID=UPI00095A4B70|nr:MULTISPECIES: sigma 54-interacting transcriptional regulator [unclassified Spirosoma]MBN8822764.1 sigma 54-interacting transcriptional regulator [Spirosoma sp.]OJW79974.1 MAG: Fis family transcriptional regulator [Spirosoma sp. 48-14]